MNSVKATITRTALLILLFAMGAGNASAVRKQAPSAASTASSYIESVEMATNDSTMLIDIDLGRVAGFKANHQVEITPVLYSATSADTLALKSIILAGRNRYFTHLRASDLPADAHLLRAPSQKPTRIHIRVTQQPWMQISSLRFIERHSDCCSPRETASVPVAEIDLTPVDFTPEVVTAGPMEVPEPKTATISGSAMVKFVVDKWDIRPGYMDNYRELNSIRDTIDMALAKFRDYARISHMTFTGYASPESPYSHNEMLATNRTASLRDYVQQIYGRTLIPDSVIAVGSVPENWQGLRAAVEAAADLPNRRQILAIIDDPTIADPDARERRIKTSYPAEYRRLLREVYPNLRKTDYTVTFEIRPLSDPDEILNLVFTRPYLLSNDEFHIAAANVEPHSDRYYEIFEIAARQFPTDSVATLNAGIAAMQRRDFDRAARYLEAATKHPSAHYYTGVLAAMREDYPEALRIFEAETRHRAEAQTAIANIRKIVNHSSIRMAPQFAAPTPE